MKKGANEGEMGKGGVGGRAGGGVAGVHGEQKQRRRGNGNDKAGKETRGGNYGSQERMGRETLRKDGRMGVCELLSAVVVGGS